jgi:hypothetical protein
MSASKISLILAFLLAHGSDARGKADPRFQAAPNS